jgi:hypothetical protein
MASETPPAAAAGGGETRQTTGEPDNHRGDGAAADGSAPMAATEAATTTAAAAPAPAAAAGAGGGDPGAIEAALAEARRAAAAGGATVGEEEDFPKGMTMVERLRKEPPLEIETVKVGIENLEVIGKLVTYNKSVLKDDEQNPVGEMYPIFMSLPAVYLKPKNMPKVSPGNIFQVAKDWHDYKGAFYFLYRPTGGSATAVCVLELLEKNTKGEVQTGSKAMFVEEYSAMKLLASPRSCDDNGFVVAGGPLVSEWSQLKKKGRVARREAAKAAAQKAEAEKVAAEKVAAEKAAAEKAAAEKAAAESKKSKAPTGKGSKGQDDTVDLDEEEDDGEDDDPLAQFKDKTWIKTNMVSKNQVNRRAPLREQLETVCATLKIKPVPSTMGLMRDAIYLKLKLNEPSPAEAAASRRAEEEAVAAKVATAAAAKTAKAEGHDLDERLPKRPKPKPPFGPPPQAEEEWIMHVDSQSDRPFWENVASGVVVWQNPLRAKPPAPPPPAVVGPGGTPASALSVASAGFDANALGGGSGSGGASYRTGCNTGLSPVLGAVARSGGNINVTIAQRGAYEGAQISHYHYGAESVGVASGGAHGRQQLGVGGQQQHMSLPLQQHGHQQHGHPQHHAQQHQQHGPPPSHPAPFY